MHLIDTPNAGVSNEFVDSNPSLGVAPTSVDAAWANAIQEEIANVITGAGITLVKNTNNQLLAAISSLISDSEPLNNYAATTNPTASDDSGDGYTPGSKWYNTVTGDIFLAISVAPGAAVWVDTGLQLDDLGTAATYNIGTSGATIPLLSTANTWTLAQTFTVAPVFSDKPNSRAALDLVIGTHVQAYDAELAALAGLTSAANKGIQFTGSGTAGTYDLTAAGKALLDDADASAQLTTLGVSNFIKTLIDDVDAAAARNTLLAAPLSLSAVSSAAATYVVGATDDVVGIDASGGAKAVTMPSAASFNGRRIRVYKSDGTFNIITITGLTTLNTVGEAVDYISDGTNWLLLERRIPSIWTTYTPTITSASGSLTNYTTTAQWRRVGSNIEVQGRIQFTGAPGTWSSPFIAPPTGISFDGTNLISSGTLLGQCYLEDSGTAVNLATVVYNGTTTVFIQSLTSSAAYVTASSVTQAIPYAWAVNDRMHFNFSAPVSGWNG